MIFIVFSLITIGACDQIIVKTQSKYIQDECYNFITQLNRYAMINDQRMFDQGNKNIDNGEQTLFSSLRNIRQSSICSLDSLEDICQQDLMKICELFSQEISNFSVTLNPKLNDKIMAIIKDSNISRCLGQQDLSLNAYQSNINEIKIIEENLQLYQQSQKIKIFIQVKEQEMMQYRILYFQKFYDYVNNDVEKSLIINDYQNENSFIFNLLPLFQQKNYFIAQIRDTQGNVYNQGFILQQSEQQYKCQNHQKQSTLSYIFEILSLLKQNFITQKCKSFVNQKQEEFLEQVYQKNNPHQIYLLQKSLEYSSKYQLLQKNNFHKSNLRQLATTIQDFDYFNNMIKDLKKLSLKLIQENTKLLQNQAFLEDIGDADTQDQISMNYFSRQQLFEQFDLIINEIKTLSLEEQNNLIIQILACLKNITESFQENLIINSPRLRYKGDNYKINILKLDYDNYINILGVKNVDSEISYVMKNTEIRIQIHQFNRSFYNLTNNLQLNPEKKTENFTVYESPELQNMTIYFTDITNVFHDGQQIKIEELPIGQITYKMQCKQDILNYSDYQFRCYSKIEDFWYFDKCQYQDIDSNNDTCYYCICTNLHPVTVVGIKIFNQTNQKEEQKQIINSNTILELQKQKIYMFPLFYILINEYCLFFFVAALVFRLQLKESDKQPKFAIELAEMQEDLGSFKTEFGIKQLQSPGFNIASFNQDISFKPPSSPPPGFGLNLSQTLAQSPDRVFTPTIIPLSKNYLLIDFEFIKTHYSSIHELTAVVKGYDRHICPFQKLILLLTNLSFVFDTSIVTYWLIPNLAIIPLVIAISTLLQIITKIFGSLFTTRVLKPIAYIFLLTFNSMSILIVFLPGTLIQEDGNTSLYTVVEAIIIFIKIHGLKQITDDMYRDSMNPLLHFVYFFLKNDTLEQIYSQCNK
ncbi:hypothetical protein pb186bvf_003774 [Paramecium bursaria]